MKVELKVLLLFGWLVASASRLCAQGYIVPNGVTYVGLNFGGGYQVDVTYNPTNNYTTGFFFTPQGITLPSTFTNTFQFSAILDVSVRVFAVSAGQPITQQAIQSGSYTELMFQNYVFNHGTPFYVGLYTGNMNFYPPNGIYADPLFGWARLVNNQGVIELLDSALTYKSGGIYAGTHNLIPVPEPSVFALTFLSRVFLGIYRRTKPSA